MYRIIGGDGQEYGPVDEVEVRRWIRGGRAGGATRARCEADAEWRPLLDFPEFAPEFTHHVLPGQPLPTSAPGARSSKVLAIISLASGACAVTVGMCCCYGLPFNLAGVICGIIALVQARGFPEARSDKLMAIIGIVLSALSVVLAVVLVLFGVALSNAEWLKEFHR